MRVRAGRGGRPAGGGGRWRGCRGSVEGDRRGEAAADRRLCGPRPAPRDTTTETEIPSSSRLDNEWDKDGDRVIGVSARRAVVPR